MYTDTNTTHATVGAIALDHLSAITAMEAEPASGRVADINDRLPIADEVELDAILRNARADHAAGHLALDDMDVLEEAARTRKAELAEATRAARRRTRQHLHEPRPTVTPEVRARIGQ